MDKKIKIAVISGGKSPEHEVSLASGAEVLKNLNKNKYEISSVIIDKNGNGTEKLFDLKVNVAFIALHGKLGEDGTIQGLFDLINQKYTGSGVLASGIGIDKAIFRKILLSENLPAPKFMVYNKNESIRYLSNFPYFVKPVSGGSSVGSNIACNKAEFLKAVKEAFKFGNRILVDEYIEGREFTCAVMGNKDPIALPVVEIKPILGKFFDYRSKYEEKGAEEIVPAKISKFLTKKIQNLALKVYKIVGCRGFGRVDFIMDKNKNLFILEINTIPGLTPVSLLPKAAKAFGLSYSELLDSIIKYANE